MEFCPMCGSMLMLLQPTKEEGKATSTTTTRFYCKTCPYVCPIQIGIKRKQLLERKGIETILSFDDMNNAPTSKVSCPNCRHGKAAYKEFQTRSADEPSTIFYACLNEQCKHRWNE